MASQHIVKQGECFSSIAKEQGFLEQTLWNHPSNAALKQKREHPNVLLPGDTVVIPDKRDGGESVPTEQKHLFKVKADRVKLQIRLLREDKPRSHINFSLTINGQKIEQQTDGDGWIRENIPAAAKTAKLILLPGTDQQEIYELLLGHLDPVEEDSGIIGRLRNLGFFFNLYADEKEAAKYALEKFQKKHGLSPTGEADAATMEKLKQMHGS